jgi:hypothetical protein
MSRELARLERWFQARMMTGKTRDASREILPSKTLAPHERLDIYADGYLLRLEEALTDDFMTVKALVGPEGFTRLVREYVTKFPSRHPSLNFLGRSLPRFLEGRVKFPRLPLLRSVAKVEVAMAEVFDEKRTKPLTEKDFARVSPKAWGKARLRVIPAFRLLELDHDVSPLVTAARHEKPLPPAPRKKTFMAVYRKDVTVYRRTLARRPYLLLAGLASGKPLEKAILASGMSNPDEVFRWFNEWRAEEIFSGITTRA